MIGLALLAASTTADTQQIQRQLDFIVSMCRVDDVVHFVAHEGNAVTMAMVKPGQLPSFSKNTALQCALAKVRARSDLRLVAGGEGDSK
ncbi:hypothetical protein [Sphingobium nicotianae]|uniref:Uncharacterized protein n=1 Tax=Sphingobium nicotianae TaxID=2782607 RepID=A0A9X1DD55_9SPHN|nr:hypothetical protein [Sphingobium nicotianae]MBT2187714.1 hypothetical protein [Sphingobium nicotianae]